MKRFFYTHKTRPLLIAGALFALCMAAPTAGAQTTGETGQLMNRIKQLENQIQTMSRAVYKGDKVPMPSASSSGGDMTAVANFEVRMSEIEDQQRKVTGQLEKLSFDLQQMKDDLTRIQADVDQRLQQLERASAPVANATDINSGRGAPAPETSETPAAGGALSNGPSESLYEEGFAAVRDSKYEVAEEKFKTFLGKYPSHPLAANAHYWLGETYYVRGDYKQAAKSFAQGYQDFPKSGKAADSLYKLGLSLARMDKKDDACLSLRQLQKEFPAASPLRGKADMEIKRLGCR